MFPPSQIETHKKATNVVVILGIAGIGRALRTIPKSGGAKCSKVADSNTPVEREVHKPEVGLVLCSVNSAATQV